MPEPARGACENHPLTPPTSQLRHQGQQAGSLKLGKVGEGQAHTARKTHKYHSLGSYPPAAPESVFSPSLGMSECFAKVYLLQNIVGEVEKK